MSTPKLANESNFRFFCAGFAPDVFQIAQFHATEEIGQPYEITLTLYSTDHNIDPDKVRGRPANFFMFREGAWFPWSGVIDRCEYLSTDTDHSFYSMVLAPRLSMLKLQRKSDLYLKQTYPDVLKKLIDAAGLSSSCTFDLAQQYPVKDHVQQEGETDFNFLTRLIEEAGMWYLFREPPVPESKAIPGGSMETIVVTDKPASFQPVAGQHSMVFRGKTGFTGQEGESVRETVGDISLCEEPLPAEIILGNYNSDTPSTKLTGKSKVKGGYVGKIYEYAETNFRTAAEADRAALVEANRFAARKAILAGTSNCRGFRAGYKFSVKEHPRASINAEYILLGTTFSGGHSGTIAAYHCSFRAIPATAAEVFAPRRTAAKPKTWFKLAVVEAGSSEYPLLDDQGRVKFRYLDDQAGLKNGEASKYARVAQAMTGPNAGIQFPLREGTMVIVGFVGGDPDRPVILNALPDASTLPPVKGENKVENFIRTMGGNELLMNDEDGKQKLHLLTKAKNIFEADDGEQRLFLQTAKQNQVMLDDKNERVSIAAAKHTVVMDYKSGSEAIVITSAKGHIIRIDDKNESITIQSKAGSAIQIDDRKKSIVMTDANKKSTVTLDGSKGLILDTKGDLTINAVGKLVIDAASIAATAKSGAVKVAASVGAMNLSAVGAVSLASSSAAVDVKGLNVNIAGTMNATMQAKMNAKVSGTVGASVEGMKTDIKGKVMTSVAGTIVKIN